MATTSARSSSRSEKARPTRLRFTDREVERLSGPGADDTAKAIEYSDTEVVGLKVSVGKTGRGIFWFRYTYREKKAAMRIGEAGAIKVAEARQRALEMRALLDRGLDPQEDRNRQRAMPTFEEFVRDEYLPFAKLNKRSYRDDESKCRIHLIPKFGNRRLCDITTRDVQMHHAAVKASHTPASANRHLALLSAIFRHAVQWGKVDRNPCTGVKAFKEANAMQRFLAPHELKALLEALEQDANRTAASALRLLLLTGTRREEALKARWEDVRLDMETWRLPVTKNGEQRWIRLSPAALELLKSQPSRGRSPWVFPGRDGLDQPINNVRKTLERAIGVAGIQHLRVHDLRHTFASLAVNAGVPLYTLQAALGHKTAKMTQRYAHLGDESLRQANQMVANAVEAALHGRKASTSAA